jgi:hypothetical protein
MSGYDSAYSGEYIPHALRTIVSRISNFRKNNLRLQTESQTSSAAGGKIRVNLPTQGLIDLGSLQFSGVVKGLSQTIKLPHAGVAGLIQRVDVEIGGVVVDSINDYNKLYSMLRVWTVGRPRNRLAALASCTELAAPFANGDFLESYSTPSEAEIVAGMKSTKEFCLGKEIAAGGEVPFNYSSWLGWLGQHRFLQMDTLPAPVSITITLDSAACTTGVAGGSFELIDVFFNVQAVEFPLLSRSLYAMLERDTPIPMPFTRWINFAMANSNGAVVANRFSVSTQALARVWVQSGLQTAQDRTDQSLTDTIRATDVAKFVSCADGANNFFLEVDNRRTSQYDIDMGRQSVSWVLGQLGVENDTDYECLLGSEGLRTVAGNENGAVATYGSYNYFGSAWALVYSLCFNEYDREDTHNVSGLNTQGMSAAIQHNARVGFTSAATTTYHCETKAVMNILPNRQIEVVY